jgi:hypothetical protein
MFVIGVVAATQTDVAPLILVATGCGLTVTTTEVYLVPQLFETAYEMVVVPATSPLTIPVVPTDATLLLLLLHTPPVVTLLSEVFASSHTVVAPIIDPAFGNGLTVTIFEVLAVPQPFVTV